MAAGSSVRLRKSSPLLAIELIEILTRRLPQPTAVCHAPDRHLYVGCRDGGLYRIEADHYPTLVASSGGRIRGVAPDSAGRICVADDLRHCVLRIEPTTGTTEVLSSGTPGDRMIQPAGLCFDRDDNLFVTDAGDRGRRNGRVFVVRPDGSTEIIWSRLSSPRGIASVVGTDELLIVEADAGRVVQLQVAERKVKPLLEIPASVPSGIAAAPGGRFALGFHRPDMVVIYEPGARAAVLAADPLGLTIDAPVGLSFMAPDYRRLVVCNSGGSSLLRMNGIFPRLKTDRS